MPQYWSATARALTPYVPGEQPSRSDIVKLNTNENPYGPSPLVTEAIRNVTDDSLRLYPDPECRILKEAAADYYGIAADSVFVGNGSDEVLGLCFLAFFDRSRPILIPDITYSFYRVYTKLFGLTLKEISVREHLAVRVDDFSIPCGGIVIANPNAPTGIALPLSAIRTLLERHSESVVIVDEAYVDFGAESSLTLLRDYPNLVVVQTMSKSRSLAGLRVGFAFARSHLIEAINRVKNSFNSYPVGRLAQAGAIASFKDEQYFQRTRTSIIRSRDALAIDLESLGFVVLPSAANFLFVLHPTFGARLLKDELRHDGILVRHFDSARIGEYLRISIGTPAQCAEVVKSLRRTTAGHTDIPS